VYCSGPPADSGAETYDGRVDVPPISHHEYARRDRRTDGRIDRRRDGRPMLCAFRYADGPRRKQTSTRAHCALPIGFLIAPAPSSLPQTASRLVLSFLYGSLVRPTHTNHGNVWSNRPHLCKQCTYNLNEPNLRRKKKGAGSLASIPSDNL